MSTRQAVVAEATKRVFASSPTDAADAALLEELLAELQPEERGIVKLFQVRHEHALQSCTGCREMLTPRWRG